MTASPEFIQGIYALLHTRLAALGFQKRKPGILRIPLGDDVFGTVGLNKAIRGEKGYLEVNVVVGLRHQRIERLIADVMGEKFDELSAATLARHLGYFMPAGAYHPYIFTMDTAVEPIATELARDVRDYGLPFMRNCVDMSALVDKMIHGGFALNALAMYRVPAGFFLLGRKDEARDYLKIELIKVGDRQDPAALCYKTFATNLAERLAGKPPRQPLRAKVPTKSAAFPSKVVVTATGDAKAGLAIRLRFEMNSQNDYYYKMFLNADGRAEATREELLKECDETRARFAVDHADPRHYFSGEIEAQILTEEETKEAIRAYQARHHNVREDDLIKLVRATAAKIRSRCVITVQQVP